VPFRPSYLRGITIKKLTTDWINLVYSISPTFLKNRVYYIINYYKSIIKMSKVLTILNIEQKLFHQVYENEEVIGDIQIKSLQGMENTISEIIGDSRLKNEDKVGIIFINLNDKVKKAFEKAFEKALIEKTNFKIIKRFDNYQEAIKGNDFDNYTSSCVLDALTETIKIYSLEENREELILKKSDADDLFFDNVIEKSFHGNIKSEIEGQKRDLIKSWKNDLKLDNEVGGYYKFNGKEEYFSFNNGDYINWVFGSLLKDIDRKFGKPDKFYAFGHFLDNELLNEKLGKGNQESVEYKEELVSYKFIINGAFHLCKDEADKEIRAIKAKDEECKCYTEPELNELYKGHNIRFFIADAKALKDLYGFKTSVDVEENKKKVEKEIPDIIGERLKINEATKSKLIENARKRCVDVAFVEAEIKKILVFNKIRAKKRTEILKIINDHVKNKKVITSSEKVEKEILGKVTDIDTNDFNIDKKQLIKKQLSDLEIFIAKYRNNLNAITVDKLPAGIESVEDGKALICACTGTCTVKRIILGLIALLIISFVVSQFIPIGGSEPPYPDTIITVPPIPPDNPYSSPESLEKALREVHSTSNKSKRAAEMADKILKDLKNWKIQSEVITSFAGTETKQNKDLRGVTDIIIGDRAANPQTIKSIEIKSMDKENKTIQIILRRVI